MGRVFWAIVTHEAAVLRGFGSFHYISVSGDAVDAWPPPYQFSKELDEKWIYGEFFPKFSIWLNRPIPGTQTHEAEVLRGFGSFHYILVSGDAVDAWPPPYQFSKELDQKWIYGEFFSKFCIWSNRPIPGTHADAWSRGLWQLGFFKLFFSFRRRGRCLATPLPIF